MGTSTKERTEQPGTLRRPWLLVVAGVSVVIVGIAAVMAFTGGGDDTPAAAPLELEAGEEDALASCIVFSPGELSNVAEIAFAGTVTSVEGEKITLSVDTWYRGGETAEVYLNAPQGMEALIGGIPFETGTQYLISAQNTVVNYCGFSGVATPEYTQAFEAAFAQG